MPKQYTHKTRLSTYSFLLGDSNEVRFLKLNPQKNKQPPCSWTPISTALRKPRQSWLSGKYVCGKGGPFLKDWGWYKITRFQHTHLLSRNVPLVYKKKGKVHNLARNLASKYEMYKCLTYGSLQFLRTEGWVEKNLKLRKSCPLLHEVDY